MKIIKTFEQLSSQDDISAIIEESFYDLVDDGIASNIKVESMQEYFGPLNVYNRYETFEGWWDIITTYEKEYKKYNGMWIGGSPVEDEINELFNRIKICHIDWINRVDIHYQSKVTKSQRDRLTKFDIYLIDGILDRNSAILFFIKE